MLVSVIVRNLDAVDTVIMVDTNIQRENILTSEKARAYKIKYKAMKYQRSKRDEFTMDVVANSGIFLSRTQERN